MATCDLKMRLVDETGLLHLPNLKAAMTPGRPMVLNVHLSQGAYTRQPC